jgi:hypothetical protein
MIKNRGKERRCRSQLGYLLLISEILFTVCFGPYAPISELLRRVTVLSVLKLNEISFFTTRHLY